MPELKGRTLGDFRVEREIGRGGMGIVFEATQLSLHRRVALKVLPPSILQNSKAVERFAREAAATAHLQHPNIVRVYSVGLEGEHHYIAMELLEGRTLFDVLADLRGLRTIDRNLSHLEQMARLSQAITREGAPPASPDASAAPKAALGSRSAGLKSRAAEALARNYLFGIVRLVADVADALHVAHEAGILHRDVKPQNLILTVDGRLVLTDFGLARSFGDSPLTRSGDFVGTPLYMSPEQLKIDNAAVDRRSDVYSLGATLYEVLTLEPPYPGETPEAIVRRILEGDPTPPRELSPRLPRDIETIALKALERQPSRRYATARELADDLRRFLNFEAIHARPQSAGTRLLKRIRRHRGAAIAIAAAVVLGVAAIGFAAKSASDRARRTDFEAVAERDSGEESFSVNRFDEAADRLSQAIAKRPDRHEYWYLRGRAHLQRLDYAEAEKDLAEAMRLAPAEPGYRLWHARALRGDKRIPSDEEQRAAAYEFVSPKDCYIRGQYESARGQYERDDKRLEEALTWFQKVLDSPEGQRESSYRFGAILSQGITLMELGRSEEAREKLAEAKGANPNASEPNHWLYLYWFAKGDFDQAERFARAALERARNRSTKAVFEDNLGSIEMGRAELECSRSGKPFDHYERAESHFRGAIALHPEFELPYRDLAVVSKKLRREAEFEKEMLALIESPPSNVNYAFAIGYAKLNAALDDLDRAKNLDEAEQRFRSVLEVQPEHKLARLWLAYLVAYRALLAENDLPRDSLLEARRYALEVLPELSDYTRDEMVAWCVIAELSFRLREFQTAIDNQIKAVVAAAKLGDSEDAQTNWNDLWRFFEPWLIPWRAAFPHAPLPG